MGLGVNEALSPSLIRKTVQLATRLHSFQAAQESLAETLEISLKTKRIERLTERIGLEQVYERELTLREWNAQQLVAKLAAPPGVKPPAVACVSYDGGRMQRRDLPDEAKSHWCETKVGVLLEFAASTHAADPCPELPETFRDLARVDKLTREIHRKATEKAGPKGEVFRSADDDPDRREPADPLSDSDLPSEIDLPSETVLSDTAQADTTVVYKPPKLTGRDVVASLVNSTRFGEQLAARAWSLGFAAAPKKAFVADGQSANWGIWEREFKHQEFVPILDFIHALTYVYAAALAARTKDEGGPIALRWLTWLWQGKVTEVIAAVALRQTELGSPPVDAGATDPRQIVATTLTYLSNQQSRMNYPEYRRQGLPVTSSHIESTIKQINYRVKGSEKFWNAEGAEALLQLRADQLSDTDPLSLFWLQRAHRATGTRNYTKAA